MQFDDNFIKEVLAASLKNAPAGDWHITRHAMYSALKDKLRQENHPQKTGLCISGSLQLAYILGLRDIQHSECAFPEHSMLDLPFDNNQFDVVFSDQVLEHIEGSPLQAFSESIRVLKPGGYAVHTTCFINEIHEFPGDFWRFTPAALRLMAQESGCEVIECAGWGNQMVWKYIALGFRWEKVPADPQHPIHKMAVYNDPLWPIATWIIARKPG